jgi:di/tricarboxylate transporter
VNFEPYTILIILAGAMVLFIWGKWRFDIVALMALMAATLCGAVPFSQVYSGISNPAVITVACVMIISAAITESGILNRLIHKLDFIAKNTVLHIATLSVVSAVLSAFMNNVGALTLMMPIAIKTAIDNKRSPSLVLLPIALASAMGGLTTMIGTPSNLLIASFRQRAVGAPFTLFDFGYVGIWVAIAGVIFISLIGWRLLGSKRKAPEHAEDIFEIQDYITEIRVPEKSPVVDMCISDFEALLQTDYSLLGIIHKKKKRLRLYPQQTIHVDDILIVTSSSSVLEDILRVGKLELYGAETVSADTLRASDTDIIEAVVPQASRVEGRSWQGMRMRARYAMSLLAIAREGKPFKARLNHVELQAGDVVLLQGESEAMQSNIPRLGLLPLVERGIKIGGEKKAFLPLFIFSVAIILAALQWVPVEVAFGGAVLMMVLTSVMPVRKLYDSIEWPIIVLLAAMIPVGYALKTTGGTELITHALLHVSHSAHPAVILTLVLVVTMTLSDFMNNAATTVVMAPIAISIAKALHVHVDPFLMAVAIGASCSFLTPVGHQNNTLVMGPGGYKFTDYVRIGFFLEVLVVLVSVPALLYFWPL